MASFGFFLFLSVIWACEAWMYLQGHETCLYKHKTPEEKELQRIAIENARNAAAGK